MKYIYECEFTNKPECEECMLSNDNKCMALGSRPNCPKEGHRKDCPLKKTKQDKKMFMLNEDGVPEWIVARTKYEALEHAASIWGLSTVIEEFEEAKNNDPEITYDEWKDQFVKEEDLEKEFTYHCDDGREITKTMEEWLEDIDEVPFYFACSEC